MWKVSGIIGNQTRTVCLCVSMTFATGATSHAAAGAENTWQLAGKNPLVGWYGTWASAWLGLAWHTWIFIFNQNCLGLESWSQPTPHINLIYVSRILLLLYANICYWLQIKMMWHMNLPHPLICVGSYLYNFQVNVSGSYNRIHYFIMTKINRLFYHLISILK